MLLVGHGVSLGSYEYLVYEKVFVAVAAEFGLQPVTNYATDAEGFQPQYHDQQPLHDLLEQVSCCQLAACCCGSLPHCHSTWHMCMIPSQAVLEGLALALDKSLAEPCHYTFHVQQYVKLCCVKGVPTSNVLIVRPSCIRLCCCTSCDT